MILQRLNHRSTRGWMGWQAVRCILAALVALCGAACSRDPPGRAVSDGHEIARVVDVTDGDTIRVDVNGVLHTVRYIGIDAPERDEHLGPASTEANRALVSGRSVILEADVSETDDYGRWLRYVYLQDGLFVNGELVRRGLARAQAYPPDVSRQTTLTRMEREARASRRGLWAQGEAGEVAVRILTVDKEAEVVDLTNVGDQPVDVAGWTLVSERGREVCTLTGILDPAATLRVWARLDDSGRGGHNCGFTANVWNNNELDPAALYDAGGRLVDVFP